MDYQKDLSNLGHKMKASLLADQNNIENISHLINRGFTISEYIIKDVHNPKIPFSFYQNFDISVDEVIMNLLSSSKYEKKEKDIYDQILKEILNGMINLKNVQKFVVMYSDLNCEDLIKIQETYNVFYSPCLIDNKHELFANFYLYELSINYYGSLMSPETMFNIVKYLLDFNETRWDFGCILNWAVNKTELNLIKLLLDKDVKSPKNLHFSNASSKNVKEICDIMVQYLGEEKTKEILSDMICSHKIGNILNVMICIKYMSDMENSDILSPLIEKAKNIYLSNE